MEKNKNDSDFSNQPFAMHVSDNPRIKKARKKGDKGVLIGMEAIKAAGAQGEFIAQNMLQAQGLNCCIILRAGDPPQYNKRRSSKSGLNLTKTSKQGLFKGALAEEPRFGRLDFNHELVKIDEKNKDSAHLSLRPTHPDYQHRMQLDINMMDILREVAPQGDLKVLGFDENTGSLRLAYKKGRGPKLELFHGQFIINLKQGKKIPIFYSREWDKPENDKNWDADKKIITKPKELVKIPDSIYEAVFNDTFKVSYTESKNPYPKPSEFKKANVFANRARGASEFQDALGEAHPQYPLVRNCSTLEKVLFALEKNLPQKKANKVVCGVYNKKGSIVAGDWDGMALGHPPDLNPQFKEAFDVFSPGDKGIKNKKKLLRYSNSYLQQIKKKAWEKQNRNEVLYLFEKKALSIPNIYKIVNKFALDRAGVITAHEFVFQQVLNHAYKDPLNAHYGEQYDTQAAQTLMNKLLQNKSTSHIRQLVRSIANKRFINIFSKEILLSALKKLVEEEITANHNKLLSCMRDKLAEHIALHLEQAIQNQSKEYVLPHFQYDDNVHDLYQHGFDMRNPYGSNLDGPWLLITADGCALYGEKQEDLVEVLLTHDFLEKNRIDVNYKADMVAGWAKVIARQIELKQTIPIETMNNYQLYCNQNTIFPNTTGTAQNHPFLKRRNIKDELHEL